MRRLLLGIGLCLTVSAFAAEDGDADLREAARLSAQWESVKEPAIEKAKSLENSEAVLGAEMNVPVAATDAKPSEASIAAKSESEIPVLTKIETKQHKGTDATTRLIISLAIVIVAAGGIALFAKYWSRHRSGLRPHTQIKVLTQFALGPKKSLAIIRVAGESLLIGITDHNISMIKSLALMDDEIPVEYPQQFSPELKNASDQYSDEVDVESNIARQTAPDDEFSFGSVRDRVSTKLREMRSI